MSKLNDADITLLAKLILATGPLSLGFGLWMGYLTTTIPNAPSAPISITIIPTTPPIPASPITLRELVPQTTPISPSTLPFLVPNTTSLPTNSIQTTSPPTPTSTQLPSLPSTSSLNPTDLLSDVLDSSPSVTTNTEESNTNGP